MAVALSRARGRRSWVWGVAAGAVACFAFQADDLVLFKFAYWHSLVWHGFAYVGTHEGLETVREAWRARRRRDPTPVPCVLGFVARQ